MKNVYLMFLALALIAGLSFAGISVTNYNVSQSTFKPGGSGVMTLIVSNPQSITGTTYRMTGVSVTVYSPPEISVSSPSNIGDIEAGGSTILTMPFKVKDTAKSGIYTVEIKLTGYSQGPTTSQQDVYSKSVTVPVTIVQAPLFTLSSDASVIGGIDQMQLTISNNGGPARNVRVTVDSSSSIALYKTSEEYAGDIDNQSALNITIDARSAEDGPADIPFILAYEDELGIQHSDTSDLRITIKNEILDLRFNQQSSLITGQDGTLSLEVVNNGEALTDVRVSFVNTSVRLKDKNEIKLGNLSAGETATASAKVYNDLAPGLNLVSAKVTWTDKDVRKEQVMNIPLTIDSDADVGVYLESNPSPLVAGQEHTVSVLVSNVGSYGISNVDVGLSSTGFESLDVTPRQYIGSLATDDFSTVQFKVRAGTAGDYPIDVNIRYRDASGEWVNKTITQTGTITAAASSGGGTLYLLLGAAAVIAAAVYWFKLRKKPTPQV